MSKLYYATNLTQDTLDYYIHGKTIIYAMAPKKDKFVCYKRDVKP